MIIKTQEVSFELAKTLKEKGFNVTSDKYDETYSEDSYTPEVWLVIEWLRLEHKIFIGVELFDNSREFYYQPIIWDMKNREYLEDFDQAKSICNYKEWQFDTPNDAYLEAIKFTLNNLIESKEIINIENNVGDLPF